MQAPTLTTPDVRTLSVPGAELTYDVRGDLSAATEAVPALMLIGTPDDRGGLRDPRRVVRRPAGDHLRPPQHGAQPVHDRRRRRRRRTTPPTCTRSSPRCAPSWAARGSTSSAARAAPSTRSPWPPRTPRTCGWWWPTSRRAARCSRTPRSCWPPAHDVLETPTGASGFGVGMAKFIALVSVQGPIGPDYLDRPDPDPAAFGLPTTDDGSRDDPLMVNMATIPVWGPDLDALRSAPCRVVLGGRRGLRRDHRGARPSRHRGCARDGRGHLPGRPHRVRGR